MKCCSEAPAKVARSVCGMQVDPANAAGQSQYQGQSYSLCSSGCKQKFDHDPNLYVQSGIADAEKQVARPSVRNEGIASECCGLDQARGAHLVLL
jgi:Cu+-exporting ATPase